MLLPVLVNASISLDSGATRLRSIPAELRHYRATTENPIAPIIIVVVVVAVAAFLALAIVIGALAAYIWYCQSHGGKWPGLGVPTAKNGYYLLRCVK